MSILVKYEANLLTAGERKETETGRIKSTALRDIMETEKLFQRSVNFHV